MGAGAHPAGPDVAASSVAGLQVVRKGQVSRVCDIPQLGEFGALYLAAHLLWPPLGWSSREHPGPPPVSGGWKVRVGGAEVKAGKPISGP